MTEIRIISTDSGLAKTKHTDDLPPHHEAWQDGLDAFNRDETEEANPHPHGSMEREHWSDGWEDGQEDQNQL